MQFTFANFVRLLMIVAVCISTGAHWAVVQSVAWTGMILENARHSDLRQAVVQTFDGRHPCALCKSIAKGSQNEKKQEKQTTASKLDLLYEIRSIALLRRPDGSRLIAPDIFSNRLPHRPPVPPPRELPG